jgi:hypothetical protein
VCTRSRLPSPSIRLSNVLIFACEQKATTAPAAPAAGSDKKAPGGLVDDLMSNLGSGAKGMRRKASTKQLVPAVVEPEGVTSGTQGTGTPTPGTPDMKV